LSIALEGFEKTDEYSIIKKEKKMIIYNVTSNVHESIHDQWMIFMQHKHIPEILATGKFVSARLVRVLIEEEMGGVTYSAQYTTDSKETLEKYYQEDAPKFRDEIEKLFGEKVLAFRTELQVVSEH
jgi:N-acetyl-gamma-glutamylphosphate reductase